MSGPSSQRDRGLYGKFFVRRADGRDDYGGDREDAAYFVLDYVYDSYGRDALEYYADIVATSYPKLSEDIKRELKEVEYRG